MTAIYTIQASLRTPGSMPTLLASSVESRRIQQRLGANPFRIYTVALGGVMAGQLTFSAEFPSATDALAFQDAWDADPEAQAFMASTMTVDPPVVLQSIDLMVEIDIGSSAPTPTPTAGMATIITIRPGAMEEVVTRIADGGPLVRKLGALSSRVFAYGIGANQAATLVSWTEAANQRDIGRIVDAFNDPSNTDAMKIRAAFDDPTGAITSYSTVLVKEIAY